MQGVLGLWSRFCTLIGCFFDRRVGLKLIRFEMVGFEMLRLIFFDRLRESGTTIAGRRIPIRDTHCKFPACGSPKRTDEKQVDTPLGAQPTRRAIACWLSLGGLPLLIPKNLSTLE
ncbi:MAG TPA: hypothetical protein VHX65_14720 [Pirellulales bacterium]|nr:hypothetical protein [Pirellulales bacterium]